MITKDPKEIKALRKSGRILAETLKLVVSRALPGVSAYELDQLAEKNIRKHGAVPSFKNYASRPGDPKFPASLCVSVNDEVVHGIPHKNKILQEGDIVGLDLGVNYEGFFTDSATTIGIGKIKPEAKKVIEAANECFGNALKQIKPGNTTGDIGYAIESTAKKYGFEVVRELVGHGVGRAVHEEPEIPCFGKPGAGTKLKAGMVIAVEPMVNSGGWKIYFDSDNWTIKTEDSSLSAHTEHTILVTDSGCEILTNMV